MPKNKSCSLKKPSQAGEKPVIGQTKPVGSSSVKKPSQAGDKPVIEETKAVPKPGKLGKEIDDIFGGRKKKKAEAEKPETKAEIAKEKRKRRELEGSNKKPKTGPRKRTEEGFAVFTEDEIGINKANAGDTRLCPFDCDCCF